MCRNRLSLQLQRFLGRFRSLPSICQDPTPPAPWQRLKSAELRSRMPSISERELEPPMACDILNSELNKAQRRLRTWHGLVAGPPAEAEAEAEISGRLRCYPKVPPTNCCLRKRNEGLCLKMRVLDKSALWFKEPNAAQGASCTAEAAKQVPGQLEKVPKYGCKDFVCILEDSIKPELTPKPLTKQKAEPEAAASAAAICLPAPSPCCKVAAPPTSEGRGRSSNVAMREREEQLFESIKRETTSHWSQHKERRPSRQFEEDFDHLRRWQKNQSPAWIFPINQMQQQQEQQQQEKGLQKVRRKQERKLPQGCEAKLQDHLSVTREDGRAAQTKTQGALRPGISCQELKEIYMCTAKARPGQQKAKENQGKCSPASTRRQQQQTQKKATADICTDTEKQKAHEIRMLEKRGKDIPEEQAPQRVRSEEQRPLRELERMSKSISLRELQMILETKNKAKGAKCALGIREKEALAERDENRGIESDSDGLALQQIEEISKLCAALKEKYEKRMEKGIERNTSGKEEAEEAAHLRRKCREGAVQAEADLRKQRDEAGQRRRLLSDLKQTRRDIAAKQQLLQVKSVERSVGERPSGERENGKQRQPEDKPKLGQAKRMVRQRRLSIAKCTASSHSLLLTPAISKWRKMEVPRGLADAFGDPFAERLDDRSKLLGKAYPTQPQPQPQPQPQCHNTATIVPHEPTRTSAFGSSTIMLRKHLSNLKRYGINDALVVYWLREAAFPWARDTTACGTKKAAGFIYDETTTMTLWPCPTKQEKTPNDAGSK